MSGTARSHSRMRASGRGSMLERRAKGAGDDWAQAMLRQLDADKRREERREARREQRARQPTPAPEPAVSAPTGLEPTVGAPVVETATAATVVGPLAFEVVAPDGAVAGPFPTYRAATVHKARAGGGRVQAVGR